MRPLLIPLNYKTVMTWTVVAIVLAIAIGLLWGP
jgi:hypothetical protein